MKVGGSLDVGDVKAKIRLSGTYVIHRGKFNVALEKVLSEFSDREFIVVIHIGLDKFLMLLAREKDSFKFMTS